METEYSQAWKTYKNTNGYQLSVSILKDAGLTQPYIDNILREAFDYAWNFKPTNQ